MAERLERSGALPWTAERGDNARFGSILLLLGLMFIVPAVWIPSISLPEPERSEAEELPPQLARLMERTPPPEPAKPEPVVIEAEPELQQAEPEPPADSVVATDPEPPIATEAPVEKPGQTVQQAREVAAKSGLLALQDQLASMRQPEMAAPQRLSSNVADPAGESTRAGESSANIALSGSGGVSSEQGPNRSVELAQHEVRQVEAVQAAAAPVAVAEAPSAPAQRAMNNIRRVFDAQKMSLDSLYRRELRQDPTLEGKVVLELTIEPDGRVSKCEVVSSDLGNPGLETRLANRVLLFNFGAEDVTVRTVRFPVDFLPS